MEPVKQVYWNNSSKHRTATAAKLILFVLIISFSVSSPVFSAAPVCTPVSAYMCAAVDDEAWVYINGIYVDYFPYVNWDQAGVYPKCVTFTGAQLSSLQPTGNVLSVKDLNTNCCEIWASWSLNITCQSGQHSYVSSDDGTPISMWHDTRGCNPVPGGTPFPDPTHPVSSRNWHDPLYVEGTSGLGWVAPTIVTGQKWGKRIWDPASGDLLPAMGYSSTSPAGVNDCQQLFFRQGFDLPVEPTPAPPNFTITKSQNYNGVTGPGELTFTLQICNTGGGTQGEKLYIYDNWTDTRWQFQGPWPPWPYHDAVFGDINENHSTPGSVTITFEAGFNANSCFSVWYKLQTWDSFSTCNTWYNVSDVVYMLTPQSRSTVVIRCPTLTVTPTITMTRTMTPTYTRTRTYTYTFTRTVTQTNSPSGTTPTFTPTRTQTPTFTRTVTPTFTITPQPTMDITKTANVGTAVFGDTITYTLSYHNTGGVTANPVCIYDTVPAALTYIGSSLAPTTGAPNLSWCIGSVAPGGSGTITWWGRITSYPFLPIFDWRRDIFAFEKNNSTVLACGYRQYSLHWGSLYTLKE